MKPRLSIGHTGITWAEENTEAAIECIAALGFHNIEIFAWTLKSFYDRGQKDLFSRYGIPLVSGYFSVDIADTTRRNAELEKAGEWGDIVRELGGNYATFGGNGVNRRRFSFAEHRQSMVNFVNEAGKRLHDRGIRLVFHPHTGTPIETEPEIRSFLDAVDPRHVGFAPDTGQIQKGGADPLKLIQDYRSLLGLVHLKDYSGRVEFDADGKELDTTGYACYTPLGEGVVNLPGILEYLENSGFAGPVLVELDRGTNIPLQAEEAAAINKRYLENLGYRFPGLPANGQSVHFGQI
jgi:inosose dehydratase